MSKPLEPKDFIVYRKERFASFLEACQSYGLNFKYAQKFYDSTKNHVEALNQALHFKHMKNFYGIVVYPHKIYGIISPTDSSDVERCNRIIRIQKNARVERFNHNKHCQVQNKFQKVLINIQKVLTK